MRTIASAGARGSVSRRARAGMALGLALSGATACMPKMTVGDLPSVPQSAYSTTAPAATPALATAAAAAPAQDGACHADSDCKGSRVCEGGRCVKSSAGQVAAAPASAQTLGSPATQSASFVGGSPQPTAYAIIVGVEAYSAGLPPPTGARSDAVHMAEMARTTLGVSRDHMLVMLDGEATKGSILRALEWARSSAPPGGRIYFYFSGHGAPDASAGTPYIVPTDGDPRYLDATALAMKDVLAKLTQTKAREVLAMVDSCFSGAGGRSVLPPGARPLVRVREEVAPAQLALFAASSGNEISGPVPGGNGGLFTRYLLDGLGGGAADVNGDGQVSLSELSEWVRPRVAREAKKDNRDQTPSLTMGKGLGSSDGFIVEWGLPAR